MQKEENWDSYEKVALNFENDTWKYGFWDNINKHKLNSNES